ncbi:sigma factor-like helix-turn-helix DNA-binding protein [Streptosporangium vulgare]|uniref:Sigma factor-like helix-turn-helix DNA-binding protein n=1 Tax=Streptosporangium vulgare TaxID=46190 RepID=A0ABV5T9P0_9ACTN
MPGWPAVGRTDDQKLVEALRRADTTAPASLYDSYAERLNDYAHSLLGDREAAAGAVHDALVAAQGGVDRLREPGRLRAWLYALVRIRCGDEGHGDPRKPSPPDIHDDPGERELAALVHEAMAELSGQEREVLELSLRHDLGSGEVGAVLGLTSRQVTARLGRARDHLENAAAAVVLAKVGRAHCPDLSAMVDSWEGPLTTLLRRRLSAHIGRCEVCVERRDRHVSAGRLLDLVPLAYPPLSLRRRVIETCVNPEAREERAAIVAGNGFDKAGFPVAAERRSGGRRWGGRKGAGRRARDERPAASAGATPPEGTRSRHAAPTSDAGTSLPDARAWPAGSEARYEGRRAGYAETGTRSPESGPLHPGTGTAPRYVLASPSDGEPGRAAAWTDAETPRASRPAGGETRHTPPPGNVEAWPAPAVSAEAWPAPTTNPDAWPAPPADGEAWRTAPPANPGMSPASSGDGETWRTPPYANGDAWRTSSPDDEPWSTSSADGEPWAGRSHDGTAWSGESHDGEAWAGRSHDGTAWPASSSGGAAWPASSASSVSSASAASASASAASSATSVSSVDGEAWLGESPANGETPPTPPAGGTEVWRTSPADTSGARPTPPAGSPGARRASSGGEGKRRTETPPARRRRGRGGPLLLAALCVLAATGAVVVVGGQDLAGGALRDPQTAPGTEPALITLEPGPEPEPDPLLEDPETEAAPTPTPRRSRRTETPVPAPTATATRPAPSRAPTAGRPRPTRTATTRPAAGRLSVSCPGDIGEGAGQIRLAARNATVSWSATTSGGLDVHPARGQLKAGARSVIWVTAKDPSESGTGRVAFRSAGGNAGCAISWESPEPDASTPQDDPAPDPTPTPSAGASSEGATG